MSVVNLQHPCHSFLVVSDMRGEPVRHIGVPSSYHARRVLVNADRSTSAGKVGTGLQMHGVIVLGDFGPILHDPPTVATGGAIPIMTLLRRDFELEPGTQPRPSLRAVDLVDLQRLRHGESLRCCSLPAVRIFPDPQLRWAAIEEFTRGRG